MKWKIHKSEGKHMKKRLFKKEIKKTNVKRHEQILQELAKQLTVTKKEFADSYSYIHIGWTSRCFFRLAETPGWRYAVWLDNSEQFYLIGEHEELVDKFRPTRTYVSTLNDIDGFVSKVKDIQNNPDLYFVDSLTYGKALVDYKIEEGEDYAYGYQVVPEKNEETGLWEHIKRDTSITQEQYVKEQLEEYYRGKEEGKQKEKEEKSAVFQFFKTLPTKFEDIKAIGIYDGNKDGMICNPRYDIKVLAPYDISQEKLDVLTATLYDYLEEESYSEDRDFFHHRFSLEGCYTNKNELNHADYRYFA